MATETQMRNLEKAREARSGNGTSEEGTRRMAAAIGGSALIVIVIIAILLRDDSGSGGGDGDGDGENEDDENDDADEDDADEDEDEDEDEDDADEDEDEDDADACASDAECGEDEICEGGKCVKLPDLGDAGIPDVWPTARVCDGHEKFSKEQAILAFGAGPVNEQGFKLGEGIFYAVPNNTSVFDVATAAFPLNPAAAQNLATYILAHEYNSRFALPLDYNAPIPGAVFRPFDEQFLGGVGLAAKDGSNAPVVFIPYVADLCASGQGDGEGQGEDEGGDSMPACPLIPAPTPAEKSDVLGAVGPYIDKLEKPSWYGNGYSFSELNAHDYAWAGFLWFLQKHGFYTPNEPPTGGWADLCVFGYTPEGDAQNDLYASVLDYYYAVHGGGEQGIRSARNATRSRA